jgi:hypothetical protein
MKIRLFAFLALCFVIPLVSSHEALDEPDWLDHFIFGYKNQTLQKIYVLNRQHVQYRDNRINLEIEFSHPFEGWMTDTGSEWKIHKDERLEEEPKIITILIKPRNKTSEQIAIMPSII